MEVLRVFNNNVLLARDATGLEVIVTGRGLGFQARPGDVVDAARVVRTFVPADGRDPDNFGRLIADIPPEHVVLADEALAVARADLGLALSSTVVIAVADHLSFAIKHMHQGIVIDYPLRAEIAHLYPRELAAARKVVAHVNAHLAQPIRPEEEVAVALHLVNAGFATGDLSQTYQMTGVFQQLFEVIERSLGAPVAADSVSAARFITHLR